MESNSNLKGRWNAFGFKNQSKNDNPSREQKERYNKNACKSKKKPSKSDLYEQKKIQNPKPLQENSKTSETIEIDSIDNNNNKMMQLSTNNIANTNEMIDFNDIVNNNNKMMELRVNNNNNF